MAVDVGSAVGYLDIDISKFIKGIQEAIEKSNNEINKLESGFKKSLDKISSSFTSAGKALSIGLTAPIMAIGGYAIKLGSDFDKGMSEVKAITKATTEDFDKLKKTALDLGESTAFSASEVAEGMVEMGKAGWSTKQIIEGMGGVLDAAAASGESLGSVSTIVADSITTFGLAATDSTKLADLLTQAANTGTIGISDLGQSFKNVGPSAATLGVSVEEVTTALAALSTSGIKGSDAGTGLKITLLSLAAPAKEAAEKLEELGINAYDSQGNFKGLDKILADLRVAFGNLTEEQKIQAAEAIAGRQGVSSLTTLLNMQQGAYDTLSKSISESAGVAKQTASVMQDNLKSSFEQLWGSLETLAVKFTDVLKPTLTWLIGAMIKFFQFLSELPGPIKAVIVVIGLLLAALGPLLLGVGMLLSSVTAIVAGFPALVAAFGVVTAAVAPFVVAIAPIAIAIGAIVTAVGLLGYALYEMGTNTETTKIMFSQMWKDTKTMFLGMVDLTKGVLGEVGSFISYSFKEIGETAYSGFSTISGIVSGVYGEITSHTNSWVESITISMADFYVSFAEGWTFLTSRTNLAWTALWDSLTTIFTKIAPKLWEDIKEFTGQFLKTVANMGLWVFEKAGEIGENLIKGIWDGIVATKDFLFDGVSKLFGGVLTTVKNTLGIASPSKLFAEEVGRWIPPGILQGFKEELPNTLGAMESLLSSGISSIDTENIGAGYIPSSNFQTQQGTLRENEGARSQQGTSASGNTFIFNSPEAITEAVAVREFDLQQRNLAFGF